MATLPNCSDPSGKRTVFLVDDHPLLRRGLGALISGEPDLVVCGESATRSEALEAIPKCRPDLAIIDMRLDGRDGLELVKELGAIHPELLSLVLSTEDENIYAERALRAGARGYITKQELDTTILDAIRCVLDGKMYLSKEMEVKFAQSYLGMRHPAGGADIDSLTDRQLEVFRLIGRGLSTRQIAERLALSVKTVESHREHIKQKLSIHTGSELAQVAVSWVNSRETH